MSELFTRVGHEPLASILNRLDLMLTAAGLRPDATHEEAVGMLIARLAEAERERDEARAQTAKIAAAALKYRTAERAHGVRPTAPGRRAKRIEAGKALDAALDAYAGPKGDYRPGEAKP